MQILIVTVYYKPAHIYGGPARSISSLCEGLARLGAQMTVFSTDLNGNQRLENVPLGEPVAMDGVQVWYFPVTLRGIYYSAAMSAALKRQCAQFDLVVIETLWGQMLRPAAQSCLNTGVPYIATFRGQLMPWAMKQGGLKKRIYLASGVRHLLDQAAAYHCTDPAEVEAVRDHGLKAPAFVVPNGLPIADNPPIEPGREFRRRWQIPETAVMLLFLGRLSRIKRPDIALEALSAVRQDGCEAYLVLAGPDEDQLAPTLVERAGVLGLSDAVRLTGLLDTAGVRQALACADLLLVPSEVQENFSMSTLEAMAAGVPVLVSEGVPVGRYAQTAGAGRVAPCTAEAFGRAAAEMLADRQALKAMGARGRALALEKFDASVVARQMLAQYQAIIATGRPLPEAAQ